MIFFPPTPKLDKFPGHYHGGGKHGQEPHYAGHGEEIGPGPRPKYGEVPQVK